MALHALKIVKEVLDREIRRVNHLKSRLPLGSAVTAEVDRDRAEFVRMASKLSTTRDLLVRRIEAECIDQPDPRTVEALAIVDGRCCLEDSKHFATVGAARKYLVAESALERARLVDDIPF